MDSIEERIRFRIKDLRRMELYFYSDNRSLEFFKRNFENNDELTVNEKISAINNGLIDLSDVPALASYIVSLPVDDALSKKDLGIVPEMASMKSSSSHAAMLHFCSLYCNYHFPDSYPIQSPNTIHLIHLLQDKAKREEHKELDPGNYADFKKCLDIIIERYGLEGMNYHEVDKFFWINASRIRDFISTL